MAKKKTIRKGTTPPRMVADRPLTSKDKLLAAALEVFSKHGYHGTTTKMISTAAGVNEAMISRHFMTKQNLFLEVMAKNIFENKAEPAHPPQETLEDEIVLFAQSAFDNDFKHIAFLKILISHSVQDDDFAEQVREHIARHIPTYFLERLRLLQKKKKIPANVDITSIDHVLRHELFAAIFFSGACGMFDVQLSRDIMTFALTHFAKGLDAPK